MRRPGGSSVESVNLADLWDSVTPDCDKCCGVARAIYWVAGEWVVVYCCRVGAKYGPCSCRSVYSVARRLWRGRMGDVTLDVRLSCGGDGRRATMLVAKLSFCSMLRESVKIYRGVGGACSRPVCL